jgi:hypothetical protein
MLIILKNVMYIKCQPTNNTLFRNIVDVFSYVFPHIHNMFRLL